MCVFDSRTQEVCVVGGFGCTCRGVYVCVGEYMCTGQYSRTLEVFMRVCVSTTVSKETYYSVKRDLL
jgi:hypothetical protein